MIAAHTAKTPLTVSVSQNNPNWELIEKAVKTFPGANLIVEEEQAFIEAMEQYERIRACSKGLSDELYQKAAKLGKHIADNQPLVEGRLELLHYLKEQSIAVEYHRYGSIFGEDKIALQGLERQQ
jgi:RHH-type proline utilization regulon transcriptional repressor/proline dehydrogenase/delta 1-pyrroline-5-carboxylate dehydrogenase